MTLAAGSRLGPYEILSAIGAGGMGEVYKARDTRLERTVAVKVLPEHLTSDEELRQRFEREAKTISQLSHPHICALYDVGREGDRDYLVMELLEGETLAARLDKGALPAEQLLRYGIEIADALDKAHRQGIVHRDLKPGNVMLTKTGVKLLDFGLAKSLAPPAALSTVTSLPTAATPEHLTERGTILGTFQYRAPEQLEGGEADARTDIFALGAVLYEMATGKRAFEGKTKTSLIAAIVSGEPKPMLVIQPLAPVSFENVVRKCIAKNRDDRWQCAADLRWQLQQVQQEPSAIRPARTSRLAWAVAAAAIVAAAVLGVIALRPNAPRRPIRFSVTAPHGWTYAANYNLGPPAVSPGCRYLA